MARICGTFETTESQKPGERQRPARRITALGSGKSGLEASDLGNGEAASSRQKRKAESENALSV